MPDLNLIQWAGAAAMAAYAAWRGWPMLKARLPQFKAKPLDVPSDTIHENRWQRERAMFEKLLALVAYCKERGDEKAAECMRDNVLPLLLFPPDTEAPDETD